MEIFMNIVFSDRVADLKGSAIRESFKALSKPGMISFAGGIWTWSGVALQYDKTFVTTKAGLSSCLRNGIKDVFATMWGDDGAECSIYEALLGMQLYAEYNYCNEPENSLPQMFKICTDFDGEAFSLFGVDTFDEKICPEHDAVVSKQVLYQDILQGFFDKNFCYVDLRNHYIRILEKLNALKPQGKLQYLFDYHYQLVKVLYQKCDIGIRLTKAYLDKDEKSLTVVSKQILELLEDYKILHEMMANIWYKNNKPFGFETLDFRLGGMETRINRAHGRLLQYLNGTIDSIPELEEARLWYGGENEICVHRYFFSDVFN